MTVMTDSQDLQILARRLTRLEGSNRRLKSGMATTFLALAGLVLLGAQGRGGGGLAGRIEAEHFVVKDAAGNVRAVLGVNPNGGAGLSFTGLTRVHVGVSADDIAGLQLLDGAGKSRGGMALSPSGTVSLELRDPTQKAHLVLNVTKEGVPSLRLLDADDKERVSLVALADGTVGVLVADKTGRPREALAVREDGSAGVDLLDAVGSTRLGLALKPDGTPSLTLYGEKNQVLQRLPAAH
jgi:hypothetical protein